MVFLRRDAARLSKLGRNRKKKQTWRKPTGRHNKMRLKRKGYPKTVSIGYKKPFATKQTVTVNNVKDLQGTYGKETVFRIGKVGTKKRIELVKAAKEKKIILQGIKEKKVLAKEKKKKETTEEPKKKEHKK